MPNTEMPRDTHHNAIQVLTPVANHELVVAESGVIENTEAFDKETKVITIKVGAGEVIRYKFGVTGDPAAEATDFKRDENDTMAIAVPKKATHILIFGETAANIYIEELQ